MVGLESCKSWMTLLSKGTANSSMLTGGSNIFTTERKLALSEKQIVTSGTTVDVGTILRFTAVVPIVASHSITKSLLSVRGFFTVT